MPGEGRPGGVAVVADPPDGESHASRSSSATEGVTEEVHAANRWQVRGMHSSVPPLCLKRVSAATSKDKPSAFLFRFLVLPRCVCFCVQP